MRDSHSLVGANDDGVGSVGRMRAAWTSSPLVDRTDVVSVCSVAGKQWNQNKVGSARRVLPKAYSLKPVPMVAQAPICYRERVTIHADAKAEGATQPSYTDELCRSVPAEVLQVAGGEVIRGKTVEAITSHVVSMRHIPQVSIAADCQVTVESGVYKGQIFYVHRVHFETQYSRPVRLQLHCKTRRK